MLVYIPKVLVSVRWIVYVFFVVGSVLFSCQTAPVEPVQSSSADPFVDNDDVVATLPIIFHIVHRGEPLGLGGNISAGDIQLYIQQLNSDFRNYSNPGYSPDIKIQFRLATTDPKGNVLNEPGVDRVENQMYAPLTVGGDNPLLMETQWNPNRYINVWVVETMYERKLNAISWTNRFPVALQTYPIEGLRGVKGSLANTIPHTADGIVLANNALNQNIIINNGVILTHEMGHFLGLFHVFPDKGKLCKDYTDYCQDTYKYDRDFYLFNITSSVFYRRMCSGTWVLGDNFMDYSPQTDKRRFTKNQMERMRKVLSYSPQRKSLRFSSAYSLYPSPKDTVIIDYAGTIYPDQKPIP